MAPSESQTSLLKHSEIKVDLLRRYLERYLLVLSRSPSFNDLHIFDLYCGPGVYENNGTGSPIAILQTIQDVYLKNIEGGKSKSRFFCTFNDVDSKKIGQLEQNINHFKLDRHKDISISYSNKNYEDVLKDVLKHVNRPSRDHSFIFIDPYGYKNIRLNDLKQLLHSNRSEVLLFLPTQFMFRFERKATPECLVDFIEDLMPRESWPKSETGIEFIENLTEAFGNSLGNGFYVDSFIITREKNQFFCLFFFTKHIYGFDRMLEVKWGLDQEDGRGWKYLAGTDLFSGLSASPNIVRFEQQLVEFLKSPRSNRAVYEFTLKCRHLPKHTNEILIKLQDLGSLSVMLSDGSRARKKSFYINYESYRDDPTKVTFK
jgi:three-Cys-motif partner protein